MGIGLEVNEVDDPVESGEQLVIVGDREQGGAVGIDTVEQQVEDAPLVARVQVAGGLVGENQPGAGQQGAADGDALLLTLGEVVWMALELVAYPQALGELTCPLRTCRSRRSAPVMR